MAAGTTAAVALGAGPALATAAPVLVPVGLGIFAVSAGSRIWKAWKDGLKRMELHFHSGCLDNKAAGNCYQDFANWVSSYNNQQDEAAEATSI